jgi:hypothetical protein
MPTAVQASIEAITDNAILVLLNATANKALVDASFAEIRRMRRVDPYATVLDTSVSAAARHFWQSAPCSAPCRHDSKSFMQPGPHSPGCWSSSRARAKSMVCSMAASALTHCAASHAIRWPAVT